MSFISKTVIAKKNDAFRRSFVGGRVLLTAGVKESEQVQEVMNAVKAFNDFTPDNDPYNEHDFGKVAVSGEEYFFKIDYYDDNYEFFQEDGNRVLTIMLAEEY